MLPYNPNIQGINILTRMTTFIKKFKISDDQTNIDKYRLSAKIQYIISKLILQRIIITNFCGPVSHLR